MSRSFFAGILQASIVAAGAWAADATPDAKQILEVTGVQGGLIVHLGCGDGRLTAALHANDRYLVHGLEADVRSLDAARQHIRSLGLYGKVSAEPWTLPRLPYADNLVNLVVAERLGPVPMDEVLRVLAPHGVAYVKQGGQWTKTIKPRPQDIAEWTHFLYDASGNAVSKDRKVAPPERLQWVAEPRWCRSHEFPSSVQAVVSAGGRLFYILDEGPIGVYEKLPQQCVLIARDAANGLLLWKRPMQEWGYQFGTGQGDRWHIHQTLPRRLVAQGDKVYVTFRFQNSPVSVVDAATGAILTEGIPGTAGADEILCADGILVVKVTDQSPGATTTITQKDLVDSLVAVDAQTGRLLWRKEKVRVAPYALALQNNRVVYHNLAEIVCLDAKTGREQWRTASDAERIPAGGSTLAISDDVVLYHCYRNEAKAGPAQKQAKIKRKTQTLSATLTALAAADGKLLWSGKGGNGWAGASTEPTDLFVANGLVWCGQSQQGRDLHTGEVRKELELGNLISPGHHPRCYRSKATECFLIWPKRGAEFVDLQGDKHMRNDWIRGSCFTGIMPANGLLYVPPSQCFCYPGVKLSGFLALSSDRSEAPQPGSPGAAPQLQRGPAYGVAGQEPSSRGNPADWPMYRHDALRSGATKAAVPAELTRLWETPLTCGAAQPTIVAGRLYVAEKDAHCIRCLDAADGRTQWTFTSGGRIDSAPTVYDGLVLFGSTDGWAYCLGAADGRLVWRFHAAPQERRVISFGQLESAWPVHGSLLVQNGVVYFAAGRSSYLDGGILVYGLNPRTGELLHHAHLEGPRPDITHDVGTPFAMEGAKSDLLVSDGQYLYLQRIKFDGNLKRVPTPPLSTLGDLDMGGRHLLATGGFLDDSGFDRLFWMYGKRWPGFYFTQQARKSGQIIVFDEQSTYSVSFFYRRHGLSPSFVPADEGYLLFADHNDNEPILVGEDHAPAAIEWLPVSAREQGRYAIANQSVDREKGVGFTRAQPSIWQKLTPVRARAMLLCGDRLFVAGTPDVVEPADPYAAFEGRKGAVLQVFSAKDGNLLATHSLPSPPMFDGLAAAAGRLYLSTADGRIACFGQKP